MEEFAPLCVFCMICSPQKIKSTTKNGIIMTAKPNARFISVPVTFNTNSDFFDKTNFETFTLRVDK